MTVIDLKERAGILERETSGAEIGATFLRWMKNDADAAAFLVLAHSLAKVWDDLTDQDQACDQERITEAFTAALVTLPRNMFYQRNFNTLSNAIENGITDWQTANALEKTGMTEALRHAFSLRHGTHALVVTAARLIGGEKWARQVALEFVGAREAWAKYAAEHGCTDGVE